VSNIERVYFKEAVYVGNENHPSLPPVSDMSAERRKAWTFVEEAAGLRITHVHPNGHTGTAFVPWGNVKGVNYAIQKTPEPSTAKGK